MKAWIEADLLPIDKDYDGNSLYGYVAVLIQDEQEAADLIEFLRAHDLFIDDEWLGGHYEEA